MLSQQPPALREGAQRDELREAIGAVRGSQVRAVLILVIKRLCSGFKAMPEQQGFRRRLQEPEDNKDQLLLRRGVWRGEETEGEISIELRYRDRNGR